VSTPHRRAARRPTTGDRHEVNARSGGPYWGMEWDDLLDIVEHRLTLYTGGSTYARAHSLIEGFELGRQGSDIMAFQHWMVARHPGSHLPWWSLCQLEALGDPERPERPEPADADQLCIAQLLALLREFLRTRSGE
jgi:hypothetical protein